MVKILVVSSWHSSGEGSRLGRHRDGASKDGRGLGTYNRDQTQASPMLTKPPTNWGTSPAALVLSNNFADRMRSKVAIFKNQVLFFYPCVCVYVHLNAVSPEGRRGHWIPWIWNYRWLWTSVWMLGTKYNTSRRAASALDSESLNHLTLCYIR